MQVDQRSKQVYQYERQERDCIGSKIAERKHHGVTLTYTILSFNRYSAHKGENCTSEELTARSVAHLHHNATLRNQ